MNPCAEHLSRRGYARTRKNLSGTVSAALTSAEAHEQTSRETIPTEEQRSRESAAPTATRHEPFTTFLAEWLIPVPHALHTSLPSNIRHEPPFSVLTSPPFPWSQSTNPKSTNSHCNDGNKA